jgi:hypothetical protein
MGGGANTLGVRTFGIIQFGGTIHAPELSSQTEKPRLSTGAELGRGRVLFDHEKGSRLPASAAQGAPPNGSGVRELIYDQQIGRMVLHAHNGIRSRRQYTIPVASLFVPGLRPTGLTLLDRLPWVRRSREHSLIAVGVLTQ